MKIIVHLLAIFILIHNSELFSQKTQLISLNRNVYAQPIIKSASPSLFSIQQCLKKTNRTLVQYTSTAGLLYIHKIDSGANSVYLQPITDSLLYAIQTVRTFIQNQPKNSRDFAASKSLKEFILHANYLFQKLKISDSQTGNVPGRLVIIADDLLEGIPFEVLLTNLHKPQKSFSYEDLPYLLKISTISYLSDITQVCESNQPINRNSNKRMFAFAPDCTNQHNLDELVFAREEVEAVAAMFAGVKLIGNQASEAAFRFHAPQSNIVHIATHGFFENSNPQNSGLFFSSSMHPLAFENKNDGKLSAQELLQIELNAELIVLSSCYSGKAQDVKPLEQISLANAFHQAGSKNVIMSLWEAEGAACNRILNPFYKKLLTGARIDVALRLAKLTYLENAPKCRKAPFFWANLTISGNGESLFLPVPVILHAIWPLFLLILFLDILSLLFLHLIRRRIL